MQELSVDEQKSDLLLAECQIPVWIRLLLNTKLNWTCSMRTFKKWILHRVLLKTFQWPLVTIMYTYISINLSIYLSFTHSLLWRQEQTHATITHTHLVGCDVLWQSKFWQFIFWKLSPCCEWTCQAPSCLSWCVCVCVSLCRRSLQPDPNYMRLSNLDTELFVCCFKCSYRNSIRFWVPLFFAVCFSFVVVFVIFLRAPLQNIYLPSQPK